MKAKVSIELEINDDYFKDAEEKKLFYGSTLEQQNIWLKQKFIDCLYGINDWENDEIKINSLEL